MGGKAAELKSPACSRSPICCGVGSPTRHRSSVLREARFPGREIRLPIDVRRAPSSFFIPHSAFRIPHFSIPALTGHRLTRRFPFMSESLVEFLESHPFWAILIIVLMIVPIAGALVHILLKAFGRRGIDNAPAFPGPPLTGDSGDGVPTDDPQQEKDNRPKT